MYMSLADRSRFIIIVISSVVRGSLIVLYNIHFNSTLLIRETSLRSKGHIGHDVYMSLAERSRLYHNRHLKCCMRYISPHGQNGEGPASILDSSNVNEKNKIGDCFYYYM